MPGCPASPLFWSVNGDSPDPRSLASWCKYTGQSEAAARDWGWLDVLHPGDRARVREVWERAVDSPQPRSLSYHVCQACGEYEAYKVLNVPLFNEAHQLQSWLVFFVKETEGPTPTDEHWEMRLMQSMIFTQGVLGILCLSLDGAIMRVNARMCQLTGYSEEELLSLTIWQLSMPEDLHLQLQAMRERLTSDHSYPPFRVRYRRKDGTIVWFRLTEFLVRQPSGEPYYFFYVAEDITAQVQSEEERAELLARARAAHSEALARSLQLEAVFEAITDGVLVLDRAGQVIQANSAVNRILHLDKAPEFLRMPYQQRIALLRGTDEGGRLLPLEQWPLARLLRGEYLRESEMGDMCLHLPDGQEIYVNHSGSPMRDQQGQVIGAVLIIHDVTERHIRESRTRNSFRILLSLAEELVDIPGRRSETASAEQRASGQLPPALSFQTAGEYLAELTCQMLEYERVSVALIDPESDRLDLIALAGFSWKEKNLSYEKYARISLTDYLDNYSITLLRNNEVVIRAYGLYGDRTIPAPTLIAPMIIDGRLTGILTVKKKELASTYTDEEVRLVKAIAKLILLVIERERIQLEWVESHSSELALREANRRFDEFLSIASHELRTPLTGIKGNIQLAQRRLSKLRLPALPELEALSGRLTQVQDYLRQAEHRINVQNRMISDLLDVSRIQANKLELVMGLCDLRKIVVEAVKDQQYNMPGRTITLEERPGQKMVVFGDADRLGQVVHNYLTNATKYSPPDQPVSVCIERVENAVRVSVHDKGPGLTPEEQKRIWERFYRVKGIPAQGNSGPGLGLGLYICRTIIEAHHGNFGLESVPGQGSTFWFSLPVAQAAPFGGGDEAGGKLTVLHAEGQGGKLQ
jgi:PAS domain S-box-containing protein